MLGSWGNIPFGQRGGSHPGACSIVRRVNERLRAKLAQWACARRDISAAVCRSGSRFGSAGPLRGRLLWKSGALGFCGRELPDKMLITHSDIAILCTLEETSVEPPSLEQTKQGAANSRLASYSGVGVLAICACGYLQRSDWQSRLLAAWLLLELWFMVYQKAR